MLIGVKMPAALRKIRAVIVGDRIMIRAGELFNRVLELMLKPGCYAERRERSRHKNDAAIAMIERRIGRDRQKGPFRHFETAGIRLKRGFSKVEAQ